jgi:hypothetical protein
MNKDVYNSTQQLMLLLLVKIGSATNTMMQLHTTRLVLQLAATPCYRIGATTHCNYYIATPCYMIVVATRYNSYVVTPHYTIHVGILMLILNMLIPNSVHVAHED